MMMTAVAKVEKKQAVVRAPGKAKVEKQPLKKKELIRMKKEEQAKAEKAGEEKVVEKKQAKKGEEPLKKTLRPLKRKKILV
jgi:hypothetical protein